MNKIINAFALAGAGLIAASASQAPSSSIHEPADVVTQTLATSPPLPPPPPTQEEIVARYVAAFNAGYKHRVRTADYSSVFNDCFSTRGAKGQEINYNPLAAARIRNTELQDPRQPGRNPFETVGSIPVSYATYWDKKMPEPVRKILVVLDRGHGHVTGGGYDPGATMGHVQEAKVVDAVATQLEKILRDEMGMIVVPTRTAVVNGKSSLDKDFQFRNQGRPLQYRAELASFLKAQDPDATVILLSLHADKAVDMSGNAITGISGANVYSYSPTEGGASASIESRKLARSISTEYSISGKSTGTRTNDYGILRCVYDGTKLNPDGGVVANLIELGFVTNQNDHAVFQNILSNQSVAKKYAFSIARGMGKYIEGRQPKIQPKLVPDIQIASMEP